MNEGKQMQSSKKNSSEKKLTCRECEALLVFHACEELEGTERAAVDAHVSECTACAAALAKEWELLRSLSAAERPADRLDPADVMLSQCRGELEESLDEAGNKRRLPDWLEALNPTRWLVRGFVVRPAWSAALLVLLGVTLGTSVPQWYRARQAQSQAAPYRVFAAPRVTDQDLQTMGIAGINWVPDAGSGTPNVELHLVAEKPLLVQGNLDDTDVRRVLTFVVENGQRFDPGLRLDSVDVLRTRSSDSDVRQALCAAARKDRNPGVRLRALEALRGFEQDELVRPTLLHALVSDENVGVRIEAINSLQTGLRIVAEKGGTLNDPSLLGALRDRVLNDPNSYIRMQSAAAIHQLGPRQTY